MQQDDNITVVPLVRCESLKFLFKKAKDMYKVGTDSILLRSPGSKYEKGRSKTFQRALVSVLSSPYPIFLEHANIYQLQPALVTSLDGPFIIRCILYVALTSTHLITYTY